MDFKKRFIEISSFLKKYEEIHSKEFLISYPNKPFNFMSAWIKELSSWDFKSIADLESYPSHLKVKDPSFKEFLKKIESLTDIFQKNISETKLPKELLRKMNQKKVHEVQTLKTLIGSEDNNILDIGSGAGHLSLALVSNTSKKSFCVDMEEKLQDIGRNKIKRWHPNLKEQIIFIKEQFNEKTKLNNGIDHENTSIIGLHSCGYLSTSIIKYSVKNKVSKLINFGCCYHKMIDEYNISSWAQKNGQKLSNSSLHLAAKSSSVVNLSDIEKRFRVKKYRYTLHYYLYDKYGISFYSLGNAKKEDYKKKFSLYAKKYHKGEELNEVSDKELNDFFNAPEVQKKIKENFIADSIRLLFGRPIEIYILLDRVIYLKEHGMNAELNQVFKRSLSPRNLMISY